MPAACVGIDYNTMADRQRLTSDIRPIWDMAEVPTREEFNWALKALHPAAEGVGAVTGIPDHEAQDSLSMIWRQVSDISPNAALTLAAQDTWDMDILFFDGPAIIGCYQQRNSNDPTKYYNGWIVNQNYDFKATTGPSFDSGTGQWLNFDVLGSGTQFQNDFNRYRTLYAGHTVHFDAPALADQGRVVVAQLPSVWTLSEGTASLIDAVPPTNINVPGVVTRAGTLEWGQGSQLGPTGLNQSKNVPTYSNLLQSATASGSWRAKDGLYIPLRFQDPALAYTDSNAATYALNHPWAPGVNAAMQPAPVGLVQYFPYPVTNRMMRAGGACFKGMSPSATLSITSRFAFEIQPVPGSGFNAMLSPSCPPLDEAVQKYFQVRHRLADAYPANYNDKNMLQGIINGIGGILGTVLPPGMGRGLAKALTPLASQAAGAIYDVVSPPKKSPPVQQQRQQQQQAVSQQQSYTNPLFANMPSGSGRQNMALMMPGVSLPPRNGQQRQRRSAGQRVARGRRRR